MTTDPVRDALTDLKTSIIDLSGNTMGEARERLVEFANLAEQVAVDLADGKMDLAEADEAARNLKLAAASALIQAGYMAEERALAVAAAGVRTALKIVVALA